MRVGVFGGSFDPIHLGHLAAAEGARDALGLDRVLLVPAGRPPHRPAGPRASAEDRYAMVRLATRGRPGFEASDVEIDRPGPSFTVDTLRTLRRALPPGTEFFLVLGEDAAEEVPRWHRAGDLDGLATLVVVPRRGPRPAGAPGIPPGAVRLAVETPNVSATEVRHRAAAGLPLDGLVPPDVAAYIAARGLYR